jgi:hypothetical protein
VKYSIPVFQFIAASGWSAILACPIRGKKGGTKALCYGRRSRRTQHTFRSQEYGEFTAEVAVVYTSTMLVSYQLNSCTKSKDFRPPPVGAPGLE